MGKAALAALALTLIIACSLAAAITSIQPQDGEQTANPQPLISWTDHAGTLSYYKLVISAHADLSSPLRTVTTTSPYYQVAEPLAIGTWYWQAQAYTPNGTAVVKASSTSITRLVITKPAAYTITPSMDGYAQNRKVDFIIDAPLGTPVSFTITSPGFYLPFKTSSLSSQTFSTFLDQGAYIINANFTVQGATITYQSSFTTPQLQASAEPQRHNITINVTDADGEPIEDADIALEGDDEDYDGATDADGLLTLEVIEGRYSFTITMDGYVDEEFRKTIDDERTIDVILDPEEELQQETASTPLAATPAQPSPTIAITEPLAGSTVSADGFGIGYTVSGPSPLSSCNVLMKTEDQRGWTVAARTAKVLTANQEAVTQPLTGKVQLKIDCTRKDGQENVGSPAITVTVPPPPQHYEALQLLLDRIDESKAGMAGTASPLYESLGVEAAQAKARQELQALDEHYLELTAAGKDQEEQELAARIDQRLAELSADLVASFTITKHDETTQSPDEATAALLVKDYLAGKEGLEDKARKEAQALIEGQQSSYILRTKTDVASITTMAGDTRYLTGITRTVQVLGEEQPGTLTVIEEVPVLFLQQAGTPTLVVKGEEQDAYRDGKITLSVAPGESYTLLFSGRLEAQADVLDELAVIAEPDYATLGQDTGLTSRITGAATSLFNNATDTLIGPLVLVIIVAVVLALIINPFSPAKQATRSVRQLTDGIHDALDLIERGRHQDAFSTYPAILDAYEKLPPGKREQLAFAIDNLAVELHAYTLTKDITDIAIKVNSTATSEEYLELQSQLQGFMDTYRQLDASTQEKLKPHLSSLRDQLLKRNSSMARQAKRI